VILSRVLGFGRVCLPEFPEVLTDIILDNLRFLIQRTVCQGIRIGLQVDKGFVDVQWVEVRLPQVSLLKTTKELKPLN
jgi:hypothetical protein